VRVAAVEPEVFLAGATEFLQPKIEDASLTGFPFYAPLLTAEALFRPDPMFDAGFDVSLPGVEAYLRESEEDGGLLIVSRQTSAAFWQSLGKDDFGIDGIPLLNGDGDSAS